MFKQRFNTAVGFFQENRRVTGCHTLSSTSVVEEISHWGECSNLSFIQHLQVTAA